MKWYVLIGCLATLARFGYCNVLRCHPGSQDSSCASEEPETVSVTKNPALPSGRDCAPGSTWKTECNTCRCLPDGTSTCTKVGCINERPLRCAPDTTWKNNCNSCYCNGAGQPVCTKKFCITKIEDVLDPVNFEVEETPEKADSSDAPANIIKKEHILEKRAACKPNQEFQSDCNSCKCSADGQSYSCTQNECLDKDVNKEVEVFMESEGVDHIERHSVCKPRDTFYIGCNTCHCNHYGTDYSCTNKPCPLPEDVELFHELKVTPSSKNKTVICEANRSFKKDCNTCWCNDDGTSYYCTRRACFHELPDATGNGNHPEDLRIIMKECRPDEVFELDCNMCRCNPDGKSFSCTRRACAEPIDEEKFDNSSSLNRKVRALSQEPPKACQPGTEFRMDCNKCLCDNEGKDFSCTRIDCNALNNNNNGGLRRKRETTEKVSANCSVGSVFERGCNVCRCTETGYALCTTNKCKDQTDKPSTDVQSSDFDANFRCNPGEQYSFDCNDCTCSADGRSIFCTLRFCDQSLTRGL